jgi:alkylation response protein AidB-like acyl-CoA dehydrogenase
MGLFGASICREYGCLVPSPPPTYAQIVARIRLLLDGGDRYLQLAPHHGGRPWSGAGAPAKGEVAPQIRERRSSRGLALTEPDAGTTCRRSGRPAVRDGDHYVINGTKTLDLVRIEGSCLR